MVKKYSIIVLLIVASLFVGCATQQNLTRSVPSQATAVSERFDSSYASESFKAMLKHSPDIQRLVEKSIRQAASINPDRETNPVQSLDELYSFLDYSVTCMPWNIMPEYRYGNFATKCDQSILYVYWLLDQPLEELEGKNLFYPSVEYLEPVDRWLT